MEVDAKQRKEAMIETTQKSIQKSSVRFFIQVKEPIWPKAVVIKSRKYTWFLFCSKLDTNLLYKKRLKKCNSLRYFPNVVL